MSYMRWIIQSGLKYELTFSCLLIWLGLWHRDENTYAGMDTHTIFFFLNESCTSGYATSFWRNIDVFIVSCAHWSLFFFTNNDNDIENNDCVALHCIAGVCSFVFTHSLLSTYIASCLSITYIRTQISWNSVRPQYPFQSPSSYEILHWYGSFIAVLCAKFQTDWATIKKWAHEIWVYVFEFRVAATISCFMENRKYWTAFTERDLVVLSPFLRKLTH